MLCCRGVSSLAAAAASGTRRGAGLWVSQRWRLHEDNLCFPAPSHSIIFILPGVYLHAHLFLSLSAEFTAVLLLPCWDVALSVRRTRAVNLRDVCVRACDGVVCHYHSIRPRLLLIWHHNNHIYVPTVDLIWHFCLAALMRSKMQKLPSWRFVDEMIFFQRFNNENGRSLCSGCLQHFHENKRWGGRDKGAVMQQSAALSESERAAGGQRETEQRWEKYEVDLCTPVLCWPPSPPSGSPVINQLRLTQMTSCLSARSLLLQTPQNWKT